MWLAAVNQLHVYVYRMFSCSHMHWHCAIEDWHFAGEYIIIKHVLTLKTWHKSAWLIIILHSLALMIMTWISTGIMCSRVPVRAMISERDEHHLVTGRHLKSDLILRLHTTDITLVFLTSFYMCTDKTGGKGTLKIKDKIKSSIWYNIKESVNI